MVAPTESDRAVPIPGALVRAIILVMVLAGALRVLPQPRTIDDAFITFRYSRNLVAGHGFVYNLDQRTLGTTTPLYTLLMAGTGWITGSSGYPWLALAVNALADAITAGLLALMAWRVSGRVALAAVIGILWAASPMSVTFAIGGMETSVAALWMVAAASAYLFHHDAWMAVFAALGVLTRIDALLWAGPLLLHQALMFWRARAQPGAGLVRRIPWRAWALWVGLLLPWHLFSWSYFGTLVTSSVGAKRLVYFVESFQALTRLLQHYATPFLEDQTLGVPAIAVGIVLYPGLAMIGVFYVAKRFPRLVPFVAYPWIYLAIFSLMNPLIFRWYLVPPLPAYFLSILIGAWAVLDELIHSRRLAPVIALLGVVWCAFSLNAWVLHPDHGPDRPAPEMAWHKIELLYQQVGEQLRDAYGVDSATLVGAGDIGAIGYFSGARILDTVGLVTPEVTAYYPIERGLLIPGANYAVPPQLILDYRPEYLVVMESFVRNGLAQDPRFAMRYVQERFIPTDFYGTGMILYRRHDAGPVVRQLWAGPRGLDWRARIVPLQFGYSAARGLQRAGETPSRSAIAVL